MGHSSSAHPVEVIMDGLKEDAAQHGASLAALIPMLVDEGGEAGHGGCQVLVQVEVCRDLDSHLVSLHMQQWESCESKVQDRASFAMLSTFAPFTKLPSCDPRGSKVGGADRIGSQGFFALCCKH